MDKVLDKAGQTPVSSSSAPAAGMNVTPVAGATAPGPPTIGTGTPGDGQATISFTPPAFNGGSPITSYTATCTAGAFSSSASGAASPLTVTGFANGTTYSCSVTATNAVGTSVPSGTVNVTPVAGAAIPTLSAWVMFLLAMSLALLGIVGVRQMHG